MEKLSLMKKFVQKIGPKKSRHLRQIQFSKFIYKISHTIHNLICRDTWDLVHKKLYGIGTVQTCFKHGMDADILEMLQRSKKLHWIKSEPKTIYVGTSEPQEY